MVCFIWVLEIICKVFFLFLVCFISCISVFNLELLIKFILDKFKIIFFGLLLIFVFSVFVKLFFEKVFNNFVRWNSW